MCSPNPARLPITRNLESRNRMRWAKCAPHPDRTPPWWTIGHSIHPFIHNLKSTNIFVLYMRIIHLVYTYIYIYILQDVGFTLENRAPRNHAPNDESDTNDANDASDTSDANGSSDATITLHNIIYPTLYYILLCLE